MLLYSIPFICPEKYFCPVWKSNVWQGSAFERWQKLRLVITIRYLQKHCDRQDGEEQDSSQEDPGQGEDKIGSGVLARLQTHSWKIQLALPI